MKILITGSSGFIGRALCANLRHFEYLVCAVVRKPNQEIPVRKFANDGGYDEIAIGNISGKTNWTPILQDVQLVIHLAARVHVMNDQSADPLEEFRKINVDATINLAKQAAAAGVKRFIYLSSIKVNGESTELGRPFTAEDTPRPQDPYGVSKYEAERELRKIAEQTGMEVVIIRPPLVYGSGVKANFASMMQIIQRGVPLPLAAVTGNRRSLVALDNLVDLIGVCVTHPVAANQTFLVSDDEDVSTAELLRRMGLALKRPAKLFYIPKLLLQLGAALLNKSEIYQRLCGSLQVDINKTKEMLNWKPPLSVDQGLRQVIKDDL
jgi:nucleoside-diphosphate-sugar epimerase